MRWLAAFLVVTGVVVAAPLIAFLCSMNINERQNIYGAYMCRFPCVRAFRRRTLPLRILVALLSVMSILLAAGCSEHGKKSKASDDAGALQNLIDIPVKLTSARWEMFGTPEYDGGVPGPTDYMTLIAEIEPFEKSTLFKTGATDTNVYLVPGVARPWISSGFRSMLEKHKNTNINLGGMPGCHAYDTTIKKSGRLVTGFACTDANRVLVYLSLY